MARFCLLTYLPWYEAGPLITPGLLEIPFLRLCQRGTGRVGSLSPRPSPGFIKMPFSSDCPLTQTRTCSPWLEDTAALRAIQAEQKCQNKKKDDVSSFMNRPWEEEVQAVSRPFFAPFHASPNYRMNPPDLGFLPLPSFRTIFTVKSYQGIFGQFARIPRACYYIMSGRSVGSSESAVTNLWPGPLVRTYSITSSHLAAARCLVDRHKRLQSTLGSRSDATKLKYNLGIQCPVSTMSQVHVLRSYFL